MVAGSHRTGGWWWSPWHLVVSALAARGETTRVVASCIFTIVKLIPQCMIHWIIPCWRGLPTFAGETSNSTLSWQKGIERLDILLQGATCKVHLGFREGILTPSRPRPYLRSENMDQCHYLGDYAHFPKACRLILQLNDLPWIRRDVLKGEGLLWQIFRLKDKAEEWMKHDQTINLTVKRGMPKHTKTSIWSLQTRRTVPKTCWISRSVSTVHDFYCL